MRSALLILLCLALVSSVPTVSSQKEDSNNTTDAPKDKSTDAVDENGHLSTLYKMSRGFVDVVGPKEDLIDDFIYIWNSSREFNKDDVLKIIKMESGFMTCLVVGLLLFFGLGIAGTFFCCCRCCCGNCGGKRVQQPKENLDTRRKTYAVLLFATIILMGIPLIYGYLVTSRTTNAILNSKGTVEGILDDFSLFLNNTGKELDDFGTKEVPATVEGIKEKVKGVYGAVKTLQTIANDDLNHVKTMAQNIDKGVSKLEEAKTELDNFVVGESNAIKKDLGKLSTDLNNIKLACNPEKECAKIETDGVKVNEISTDVLTDLPKDITAEVDKADTEVGIITDKIHDKIDKTVKDQLTTIEGFVGDFQKSDFQKVVNTTTQYEDMSSTSDKTKDAYKEIEKNNRYVYYGLAGVVSLVTLPVILLCLGMLCGCAGHRNTRHPSERGCVSNCGGCTMITGVYLLFFITGLPILVTTMLFQLGGHAQIYVCNYVYEDDFKTFDKIYDNINLKDNELLKQLKPSVTLRLCKNGSTLYQAFGMDKVFDVDKELDLEKKFDIKEKLKKLDFGVKDMKFFDGFDESKMNKLNSFDQTKYDDLKKKMGDEYFNQNDMHKWIEALRDIAGKIDPPAKRELENKIVEMQGIEGRLKTLAGKRKEVKEKLEAADPSEFQKLATSVKAFQANLEVKAEEVKNEYLDNIENYVKSKAGTFINDIKYNIGNCQPIWNIFDSSRHLVCHSFLDPLNGYWFCLGWALFFSIFAIAFGTKLSKHYMTMSDMESRTWNEDDLSPREYVTSTEASPCISLKDNTAPYNYGYQTSPVMTPSPPPYIQGPNSPVYVQPIDFQGGMQNWKRTTDFRH